MRWRISSTAPTGDDLQFQILGDNGYQTHRFFAVAVSRGRLDLRRRRRGSCFQYVSARPVPRRTLPPSGHRRSRHLWDPAGGAGPPEHRGADARAWTRSSTSPTSRSHVSLTDTVAFEPPYVYPRSYDRTMWPTKGLCVSDVLPTGVSFSPLDTQTYGFPPDLPLSDSGIYCVGIRDEPRRMTGSSATVAQGRVATVPASDKTCTRPSSRPSSSRRSSTRSSSTSRSRSPIAAHRRCRRSSRSSTSTCTRRRCRCGSCRPSIWRSNPNATGGSPNCAQLGEGRKLPATDMADAVLQQVSSFPETHQQFHFFYFNNSELHAAEDDDRFAARLCSTG